LEETLEEEEATDAALTEIAVSAVVNGGVKTGQMAAQKLASSTHRI
jgi:ferritin-like metal-binding protein YciE